MSYFLMKSLHLVSIVFLVCSIGLLICAFSSDSLKHLRKFGFMLHGIAWATVFGTAYGLVEIMNLHVNFPAWAKLKFVALILLGVLAAFIKRKPKYVVLHFMVALILCTAAVVLAVYKPAL